MNILYATMQYGRGYSQGTERYLSILSRGMQQRGHSVAFLAGDPERRGAPLALGAVVEENPRVMHVPTRGWMAVRGEHGEALQGLIASHMPDILHVANPGHIGVGVIDAARTLGLPIVVSVVDFWWLCPKHTLHHHRGGVCDGMVSWVECQRCIAATHASPVLRGLATLPLPLRFRALDSAFAYGAWRDWLPPGEFDLWKERRTLTLPALDQANEVIFLSATGRDLLERRLRCAHSTLIRNGLEPHWFDAPPRAPRGQRPPVLGFAGAIAPHKGLHTLLGALQELRGSDVRLRVASASEEPAYARRIRKSAHGLDVEFVGRVAPAEMPAFLSSLDLLVVPSEWPENLPMVAYEAFARGTPVLSSDMPGVAEIVADERMIFRTGDARDLAHKLRDWRDRADAPTIPHVNTVDEMCAATLAVYDRAAAGRR